MADHAAHASDHGSHEAHYIRIWAILLVLLLVSIAGPWAGITIVTLITAFGIAFVKAYMVAKNFMHVTVESPVIWYIMLTVLALMVLFFAAVAPDVMNHDGSRWENVAAKKVTADAAAHAADAGGAHGAPASGAHGGGHGEGGH
jgi:caa(3)-type oxidase subunit IV